MFCSVICCVTAWRVEYHKLHHVGIHPICIFWLIPQFILFEVMEGLNAIELQDFFESQVSESMNQYGP
ncbi:hypothetical protein A4A49_22971 [Nicotiana attenuata]|uniref:Uncharacterized protein n=1 Tax=Nicotiana attenuata TaxID=49451 RepID=A0A314KPJ4_NICAT|nr:hypothetical protein A4A49_22971 [Nicotiana attenuata]